MNWIIKIASPEAEKELNSLPNDLRAKFLQIAELIEKLGPIKVGMPHIKFLGDKLCETRLKGRTNIARSIFIVVTGREIIILHTFIKKTQQTPTRALELAKERLKRWKNDQ